MKTYRLASVGFIVFISIAVLFFGIRFLQNESFQKSTFTFKVVFNDLQGLDISDDVRMLGKKIGRVSGTEIIGQKIAVQVTIDNSFAFKLPIDSDIEITQSDLMGGKFISIYPGKDINNFILPAETISGSNTVAASLTEDISNFAKKINETYGQKQKEQVKNTISSIETSSALLEEFVASNMDLFSDEDKDNLHGLLLNINNVSNDLSVIVSEESDNIKESIDQFNVLMKKLPAISDDLNEAVVSLKDVLMKINSENSSFGKMINDDELYNNINGLIIDSKSLVNDIKDNPTKYLRAYFAAKKK